MKKITLAIPDGYQVPEGVSDGQTFDESCTFRLSGQRLELTAINGINLDPEERDEQEGQRARPEPSSLADGYMAQMAAAQSQ